MTPFTRAINVDSDDELAAFLTAFAISNNGGSNADSGIASDLQGTDSKGRPIKLSVQRRALGTTGSASRFGVATIDALDELMLRAFAFSAENPPHHPGTIARFPMPSDRFAGCVEIPLAVLAVEAGRPGMYAPPRVAVLDWQTAEPRGIGEFPGFSPEDWPPLRLGNWPPGTVHDAAPELIGASAARLSGCLGRLIDHELGLSHQRAASDVSDARTLIHRLDLPAMMPSYHAISKTFAAMLDL